MVIVMKLEQYLNDNEIKHHEFAGKVGTSQASITRYVNGDRRPSIEMIEKIKRATKGKVQHADWIDPAKMEGAQ